VSHNADVNAQKYFVAGMQSFQSIAIGNPEADDPFVSSSKGIPQVYAGQNGRRSVGVAAPIEFGDAVGRRLNADPRKC
jgi:hypothetical protein